MKHDEFEQREIYFSGRVQGVGFRYTTYRRATNYDVTGFVQNLPDGRVKLVVEGSVDQIETFVASIQSSMTSNIQEVQTAHFEWTGAYSSFEIRRS